MLIMAGFVLAYAAAFLLVALHKKAARADIIKRPVVRWMPATTAQRAPEAHYLFADLMDPSLLSLPNPHGFSRGLWQRQTPVTHRALAPGVALAYLNEQKPAELPLLLDQAPLGDAVRSSVDKSFATLEDSVPIVSLPASTVSTFRIEGDLADRSVVRAPALPAISSETPLRPTQVRVGVGADGTVRYAMLQRSSGNETVDAQAVELARGMCFEPQNSPANHATTWGSLRLYWVTTK